MHSQDHAAETYCQRLSEAAEAHRAAAAQLRETTRFPERWQPLRQAHERRAADLAARAEDPRPEQEHSTAALAAARPQSLIAQALSAAEELPSPEDGISRPALDLRIGIICDRFLYDTFTGLAPLTPITGSNWREHLGELDLLLVAATWRGHDGHSWDVTAEEAPARRRMLIEEILPAYRDHGVPTLFYGKEDPPDYQEFLDVAQACEHIATTAEEMLPRYAQDCPQARSISVLPFAVNPQLHTPLGSRRPRPGHGEDVGRPAHPTAPQDLIFFAGSWMGRKYPQRARYARWILDGVLSAGRPFALVDRWWGAKNPVTRLPTPNQLVPFEYWPHRTESMGHDELMQLQRITDVAVNFNSVTDSMTMFANRVLELQASGTMVLSTYSRGVETRYPQVHTARSAEDVRQRLEDLDLEELRAVQSTGIREVFLHHHGADLLAGAARRTGVEVSVPTERVIAVTEEITEELRTAMEAQELPDAAQLTLTTWAQLDPSAADILLPVSPEHRYPTHYAADHLAAFRYQSAAVTAAVPGSAEETDHLVHRHIRGASEVSGLELGLTAWWIADREDSAAPSPQELRPQELTARLERERIYLLPHGQSWQPPAREPFEGEGKADATAGARPSATQQLASRVRRSLQSFKQSRAGHAAAAVYRRTLKPSEQGLRVELEQVTEDIGVIDALYEQLEIPQREAAAEAARRQLAERRYSS